MIPIVLKSHKSTAKLAVVAIVATHVFFLWSVRDRIARGDPDFTVFYTAGKMLRQGLRSELYNPRAQQQVQSQFATDSDIRRGPLPYIHPPFEALVFMPLTLVPYGTAFVLWSLLNLLMLAMIARLLQNTLPGLRRYRLWEMIVLFLAFFPVLANFHQGQDAILLLLIVTMAFRAIEKNSSFASGCWMGLGTFKYHLVLPLFLIFVVWKGRRFLSGFMLVCSAAFLTSLAIVGWRGALQYPAFAWHVVSDPSLGGIPFRRLPNLLGLVAGWSPTASIGWKLQMLVLVASVGLVVVVTRMAKRADNSARFRLCISSAIIVAVLVAYSTNTYDLCLLILPLAVIADYSLPGCMESSYSQVALFAPAFFLCLSPLWFFLWMSWERINLMAIFLLWWVFAIRNELVRIETHRMNKQPVLS